MYGYAERLGGRHRVVLGGILYQQLDAARDYLALHVFVRYICFYLKAFREAQPQQVGVFFHERHLFAQRKQGLVSASEHISVYVSKFVRISRSFFGGVFLNQAVQRIERIEQKMRIDLLFEAHVAVLDEI